MRLTPRRRGRPCRAQRSSGSSATTPRYVGGASAAPASSSLDALPRVVLVPGLGMFTAGRDARTAGIVSDIYHHTIAVHRQGLGLRPLRLADRAATPSTSSTGRSSSTSSRWRRPRRSWPAASRSSPAAAPASAAPSRSGWPPRARTWRSPTSTPSAAKRWRMRSPRRSAAVVRSAWPWTSPARPRCGRRSRPRCSPGAASTSSCPMPASPTRRRWIAWRSADWERSFAVNSTGHFLVAREAMRVLIAPGDRRLAGLRGHQERDVAGQGLRGLLARPRPPRRSSAKVLALEGAPHGIRSNIVNPDAVFQDSKLWSEEIRRERAAAQGIAVDQLEDFYRKRNLLGARILPEDVAEAVLFLASDRAAKTTGCTLTVDGGVQGRVSRADALRRSARAQAAGRAVRAGAARGGAAASSPCGRAITCPSTIRCTKRSRCWRRTCPSPAGSSLGTAVYLLALRPPAIAAKITSTLDALSGGRLIFGVGVGGENPKEFEVVGVPHHERGARVTEAIDVVRTLWRDTPASFDGRFTAVRRRVARSQARAEAGTAHLDRRALGRRADRGRGGRATAGCPTSCSPSATRRAWPRSRRGGGRPLARRLRVRAPGASSRWAATRSRPRRCGRRR